MGLDPRASSDVTDGATVSVPPELPDRWADPGLVSRVGRESWDIELDDSPEPYNRREFYAIDPGPPTAGRRPPKADKCWPQYTLEVGSFACLDTRPSKASHPLRPSNHRKRPVHPDRKGLPRSA
jgi:hypothetical protein